MSDARVHALVRARADLGEGPVWHAATSSIVWTDIPAMQVHVTDAATGQDRIIARAGPVGCLVEHADGGFVLAEGPTIRHVNHEFEPVAVLARVELGPDSRFNDGATDPVGRLLVGTLSPTPGQLLRVDPDGTVTTLLEDIACSNGLAWSGDGRTLYFIDSPTGGVDAIEYDVATGTLGERRQAIAVAGGLPDGLTIDDEDCLWVAVWGTGEVRRYRPSGELLDTLTFPTQYVTCPAFGGPDLGTLYVTSASIGFTDEQRRAEPDAGSLFACTVQARGRPLTPFGGWDRGPGTG